MSTLAPFPDSLVKEFDDKVIAIVGYEFDQVMRDDDGTETPVPVTWSYNHHYSARVVGKYAEMYPIKVTGLDDPRVKGAGHLSPGSTVWAHRNVGDPRPKSSIPTIVDFDEANGGEWRKSFHGYPHGYAQLVDSPIGFRIEPMQIDTRSRDGSMRTAADGFHPDPTLVPKSYAAPLTGPDAVYSGLLECPCTDRISKVIDGQYNLQAAGACPRRIVTVAECRKAIEKVGLPNGTRAITEGTDPTAPPGCSVVVRGDNLEEQKVFFNHLASAASCGGKPSTNTGVAVAGVAQSLVSLQLDVTPAADNVTITVSGPADVWFGLAFGATEMAQQPVAVIVDGSGAVTEYQIGDHVGGSKVPTQVTVVSNTVVGNTRTVVLRRGLVGATPAHYTFNASAIGVPIPWMNAVGSSGTYAFHKDMSSSSVVLARLDTPLCVCGDEIEFGSAKGQVVYTHDDGSTEAIEHSGTSCTNTTPTDLIPTRNPRCDLTTYVGGLSCCHHQWLLTDREQRPRISNDTLKFWMKVRLWYQEYIPATPTAPASHELLVRMYHSIAGEYDVVKNPTGVQTNVFKFQVKDMLHPDSTRNDVWATGFPTPNQTGIKLMYINGHCHAAACITFDLYNDDTGELLCRQVGRMGSTLHPSRATRFDEKGYVRLYPCVFGTRGEGLPEPTLLTFNTTLRSVKITNATYTHYGEMAHWQARGVLA